MADKKDILSQLEENAQPVVAHPDLDALERNAVDVAPQDAGLKKNMDGSSAPVASAPVANTVSQPTTQRESIATQFLQGKVVGGNPQTGISVKQDDGTIATDHPTKGRLVESPGQYFTRTTQENTQNAHKVISNDIVQNISNLPSSYRDNLNNIPFTQPGNIVNDLSSPHGDADATGSYVQHRQAQLNQQRQEELATYQAANIEDKVGNPAQYQQGLDAISKKYQDQKGELQEAASHMLDLQLGYQAVKNQQFDAVRIGIKKQAALGDPMAEKAEADLNNDRPLPPEAKASYQYTGLAALQTAKNNALSSGEFAVAGQIGEHSNDIAGRLEKDNKEFYTDQRAKAVGRYIADHENPIYGTLFSHMLSQGDIDAAGKELGFTKPQMKGVTPEKVPSSAGMLAQAAQSAVNTAAAPLYEAGMRGLATVGIADKDAVNERFTPGWDRTNAMGSLFTGQTPDYQEQLSVKNPRSILASMANGVGSLAGFLTAGEATGGLLGKAGLSAATSQKIANFATAALPSYNEGYERAVQMMGDKPEDEVKRQAYALSNGMIGGAVMMIDPKANLGRDILGATDAGKTFSKMIEKGGLESMTKPELQSHYQQILEETAKHLGLQVAMPTIQTAAGNLTNMIADPQGDHHLMDNEGNAALSGAIGMFIPSLMAGIVHPKNQSALNKELMYEVGSNPYEYKKEIATMVEAGRMSHDDAQTANNAIDRIQYIIGNQVPTENLENNPLTDKQKQGYAWNLLQESELQKKLSAAEGTKDKAQIDQVKSKISELEKERKDILGSAGEVAAVQKAEGLAPEGVKPIRKFAPLDQDDAVAGPLGDNTFKTSKGSEYILHDDGTTTRNKAERPDAGHEGQKGEQPRSEKTYFVTKEDLNKLDLVQTSGWRDGEHPTIADIGDGKIAVGITGGSRHGMYFDRTEVQYSGEPKKGLYPVEVWDGGVLHHFGNEITEVSAPAKKEPETLGNSKEDVSLNSSDNQSTSQNLFDHGKNDEETNGGQQTPGGRQEDHPNAEGDENGKTGNEARQDRPIVAEENSPAPAASKEVAGEAVKRRKRPVNIDVEAPVTAEKEKVPIIEHPEFNAWKHGDLEGTDEKEAKDKIKKIPNDQKVGGPDSESFNDFVSRIKSGWENLKGTAKDDALFVAHSSVKKVIEAAEEHGWNDVDKLKEAYLNEEQPKPGELTHHDTTEGELHVTRHAQSVADKQKVDDPENTPLSAKGKNEAKGTIVKSLKSEGITPSEIHTSELPRATNTAAIVQNELFGGDAKVLVDANGDFTEHAKKIADDNLKNSSLGDINKLADDVIGREKRVMEAAFGEEGYREYKRLRSIADSNSSSREAALEAEKQLDKMHNSLTASQKKELSIQPEEYYDASEYKRIKKIANEELGEIAKSTDDQVLLSSIGRIITTGDAENDIEDHLKFKGAYEELKSRGYSDRDIIAKALSARAEKGENPEHLAQLFEKNLEKIKTKKPSDASTQSKEQQQEGHQQSGEPEHARIEQAGSEGEAVQASGSDSDQRSQAQEEVKSRKRKGRSWNLPDYLRRRDAALSREPQSLREHILQTMLGMTDDYPERKWSFGPSERKDLSESERRFQNNFLTDTHGKNPIDVWAHGLKESAGEQHGAPTFNLGGHDEQSIRNEVIDAINGHPTKQAVLESLEQLQSEQDFDNYDHQYQEAQQISGVSHDVLYDMMDEETRKLSGKVEDKINEDIPAEDSKLIHDYLMSHMGDDGVLKGDEIDPFSDEYQNLYGKISKDSRDLLDAIITSGTEKQKEYIDNLKLKISKDENKNTISEIPADVTARADANATEGSPPAEDAEQSGESADLAAAISEKELALKRERASQHQQGEKRAAAEKSGDIEAANKANELFYKKQVKIDRLNEEIDDLQKQQGETARDVQIKAAYKKTADKLRTWTDKHITGEQGMVGSFPFITPKNTKEFLHLVADGIEKFGHFHAGVYDAIQKFLERHPDEKVGQENIAEVIDKLPYRSLPLDKEPALHLDNEEYAKDIIDDINKGKLSYADATKEVVGEKDITEQLRGKILRYIDWHLEMPKDEKFDVPSESDVTSIRNTTTRLRREQFGLNEEIPSAKKDFGETWDEATSKIEKGYDPANLIEELSHHPRPITDVENAVLLHQQNKKEIDLLKANENINRAAEEGDKHALAENKATKARILDELQKLYDVNKAVGTENARGLAARRMMVDRKYSLANMVAEKRATANDGMPLNDEQQVQIEELHQKIKETQDAFDNYIKESDSRIVDLQRREIEKGPKDKKTASARLREFADKIEQANKNTLYSSPIPITPKMIAEGIRLIAAGVEQGEKLAEVIKKAIASGKKDNPGIDETSLEKELNKAVIDSGILDPVSKVKADMGALFTNGKLDREAVRLKVEADRAKAEYDIQLKRDKEAALSKAAKVQNLFLKVQRAFKLSNPLTIGKLMMAGFTRLATTPLEDIVGGAYSTVLPQLAKGAIGEGGGLNVAETALAYKNGLIRGLNDASEIMKKETHGKSELDVLFGKAGDLPPEMIDFFGKLHSATKAPFKRIIFERSLERRLRRNMAAGVDVTDPMVQTSVMVDAYKDANRAIFMNDNKVAEAWQKFAKSFEKVDPVTGEAPHRYISTALQWLVPFVKIPTNIAAEIGTHVYGVPVGVAKLVHAAFTDGIADLPADQKDIILRNLKKGSLGLAALSLGYFNPANFGGYYQPKQKRDEDDAEVMGTKFGDVKLPAWLSEAPLFQAMQLGATVRRVKEQLVHGEEKGIGEGIWAGLSGLAGDIPMVSQPLKVGQLFESPQDRNYYFGEVAKSTVDPALLTYLAKVTDPADEGNPIRKALAPENHRKSPKTVVEHIKSGLPYFREDLDEK